MENGKRGFMSLSHRAPSCLSLREESSRLSSDYSKKKKQQTSLKDKQNVAWNAGLLLAAIPKSSTPILFLLVIDETRNGKLASPPSLSALV